VCPTYQVSAAWCERQRATRLLQTGVGRLAKSWLIANAAIRLRSPPEKVASAATAPATGMSLPLALRKRSPSRRAQLLPCARRRTPPPHLAFSTQSRHDIPARWTHRCTTLQRFLQATTFPLAWRCRPARPRATTFQFKTSRRRGTISPTAAAPATTSPPADTSKRARASARSPAHRLSPRRPRARIGHHRSQQPVAALPPCSRSPNDELPARRSCFYLPASEHPESRLDRAPWPRERATADTTQPQNRLTRGALCVVHPRVEQTHPVRPTYQVSAAPSERKRAPRLLQTGVRRSRVWRQAAHAILQR
jgi:hypothetical protein